jgi:hypothetical protein
MPPKKNNAKGQSAAAFAPRTCYKCSKPITSAGEYLVVISRDYDGRRFADAKNDCHRACFR